MFGAIFETAAILDDFLQTHTCPLGSADSAFSPRGINHLVAFTRILDDLFESPRTTALKSNEFGDTREASFVLQVSKGKCFWVVDQPIQTDVICAWVYVWNTTVVADKMKLVWHDVLFCEEALRRFSVIGKL
jgi:hypothetical protein